MATPNVAGIAALIVSRYGGLGRDNGGRHNGWGGDGEPANRLAGEAVGDRVERILTAPWSSSPARSRTGRLSAPACSRTTRRRARAARATTASSGTAS